MRVRSINTRYKENETIQPLKFGQRFKYLLNDLNDIASYQRTILMGFFAIIFIRTVSIMLDLNDFFRIKFFLAAIHILAPNQLSL